MTSRPPDGDALDRHNRALGLGIPFDHLDAYLEIARELHDAFAHVDGMPSAAPTPARELRRGHAPDPEENRWNAWAWRVRIPGEPDGALADARVAVKDSVCVAGVPLHNGSSLLEGYVPELDATVVTRTLQAGGTIVGIATCEDLCFSAGSHTSAHGPVHNPHDPDRMAGGSSSGSAVAVAQGEADVALGADQAGSLRIPAAWCGVVALKPTYGLVPYTGVVPVERTLDHCGPLAPTVRDAARYLEALAGPDGLDERQYAAPTPTPYVDALTGDADGLRVGLLDEGFGWQGLSDPRVDATVRERVRTAFDAAGAPVTRVSVPWHRHGQRVHAVVSSFGAYATLGQGEGVGTNHTGPYPEGYADAMADGLHARADRLSATAKAELLVGRHLHKTRRGRTYAKAQNLRPQLRAAYDRALSQVDVLALPTTPSLPHRVPEAPTSPREVIRLAGDETANTAPFNLTGHPAVSVNAGWVDGVPVGVMFVGRHGDERTLLRAADAFETHARSDG